MALRIIRKSASQAHIELIRGSAPTEQKPLMSLLLYIDSIATLGTWIKQLEQAEHWLHHSCEVILMKAFALTENIRNHLPSLYWNCKILQEPENTALSKRLRMLVQEAQTDVCMLGLSPTEKVSEWAEQAWQYLSAHPTCGAVGPILALSTQQVDSAGLSLAKQPNSHGLVWDNHRTGYTFQKNHLQPLGRGLPAEELQNWFREAIPVTALSLTGMVLRRQAYLDLPWENQPGEEAETAWEIGCLLHKGQYWVKLLPFILPTSRPEPSKYEIALPQTLLDRYASLSQDDWELVYRDWGFERNALSSDYHLNLNRLSPEQQLNDYLLARSQP